MRIIRTLLLFCLVAIMFSCNQKSDKPQQTPFQTSRQNGDTTSYTSQTIYGDQNYQNNDISNDIDDAPQYFAEWNGKLKYFDTQNRASEVQKLADLHVNYIMFLRQFNVGNGFNQVYSSINSINFKENEYENHTVVTQTIGIKVLGIISFTINGLETDPAQIEIYEATDFVRKAILVSDCASVDRANECLSLIRKAESHYNNAESLAKAKEQELRRQLQLIFK